MPIASNFSSVLEQEFEINFLQCYPNGALKYTELCNLLQITAGLHADLGGISFSDMQKHHQAWVLSRMLLEITELPKWRDKIVVKTWINSLENSRSIRCLEVYHNHKKIIGCETLWVVFNTKTRKPDILQLPHEHFEKIALQATQNTMYKIDTQNTGHCVAFQKVMLSDLDIVNHMNNVKYLEWCLNYEDSKTLFSNAIKSIAINFIRELNLGDQTEIFKHQSQNSTTYSIVHNAKHCYTLDLKYM